MLTDTSIHACLALSSISLAALHSMSLGDRPFTTRILRFHEFFVHFGECLPAICPYLVLLAHDVIRLLFSVLPWAFPFSH